MTTPTNPSSEKPSFRKRFRAKWDEYRVFINIGALLILFLLVYLASSIFIFIGSGDAGVLYRRFAGGTQTKKVYGEGLHIIAPWDSLTIYNVRLQQVEHSFDVISKDGLTMEISISVRYRPKLEMLGVLHQEVGPDYVNTIVLPEVQALIRTIFGQYTPDELYTTKRSLIQNLLESALGEIGERYIILDDLLIKSIKLPIHIKEAIEAKLAQQQASLEMEYRITREKQEAQRRQIEAEGIRQFQTIISQGITDRSLKYRGIDATLELAKSPNAKVVVIGGKDGMPLILDTRDVQVKDAPIPSISSVPSTSTNSTESATPAKK